MSSFAKSRPVNTLLRFALGALIVFVLATGPALAAPHMLGMHCEPDCAECAAQCRCEPAGCFEFIRHGASEPVASPRTGPPPEAAPVAVVAPGFPGAPPRGPPA